MGTADAQPKIARLALGRELKFDLAVEQVAVEA
jgi:hypothetical protein